MTRQELLEKHPKYAKYKNLWDFWATAYQGTEALIDANYLVRNERESKANYELRMEQAFGFDYSSAVIDLVTYYLFEKEPERDLGKLGDDELWHAFVDDCDLYDSAFSAWLNDQQKWASIYGHVGILIDKPQNNGGGQRSRRDEINEKIYPYVAAYHPQAIFDWTVKRNPLTARPELVMLKLQDEDNKIRIWTPESWQLWDPGDDEGDDAKVKAILIAEGINPLGVIPFVLLKNRRGTDHWFGEGDLKTIARLDVSIMRNLSQGEEIFNFAAFPMLRVPESYLGKIAGSATGGEIVVSERTVLPFDDERPESKPDWLSTDAHDPIMALLDWIGRKVQEIYRIANVGGIHFTEMSEQAKSGVALRHEFQQLNSLLTAKAENLESAELSIIYYWLLWQKQEQLYKDISVKRPRDFSIEDLAADLENALTAKTLVPIVAFHKEMMKSIVAVSLPGLSPDKVAEIHHEIDALKSVPFVERTGTERLVSLGEGSET